MALINGQESQQLSILDRGFQYGDGVFETLAIWRGQALCLQRHLRRMAHGCRVLGIPIPDATMLQQEIAAVSARVERGVVKLTVTRGTGGRGYAPPPNCTPSRIVSLYPWPEYPSSYGCQGIATWQCRVRLSRNPLLAGIKHLNRLEQVLARRECPLDSYPEGIMLDTAGWVIEGIMSNLFLVSEGQLITPCLTHSGVAGVMREIIMEVVRCEHQLTLRVRKLRLASLEAAEEIFFCNSLFGIWPVRRFEHRTYRVGPVTQYLQGELLRRCVVVHG